VASSGRREMRQVSKQRQSPIRDRFRRAGLDPLGIVLLTIIMAGLLVAAALVIAALMSALAI